MKPPLTPMRASPGSTPAFPAGLSGATSMTFRTSRPLTCTCSARIPSRCKIDPPAAAVEVEGGAAGAWPGAASAGGSGSLGTRFWATMPAWSNQSGKAPSQPPCPGDKGRRESGCARRVRAVAAGTWSPLVFWRRLEDVDVNLVAGCRCLHSLGIGWRPAVFRPRDFNLDHIINLCLSGAAKNLAHDPIDDDRRPFLGLRGPLGGRGRAKHAHDAQRDRGSEHRSVGVTHVGSLDLDEEKARLTCPQLPSGVAPIRESSPAAWPRRT